MRSIANTIRGKILLAFCTLAAVTGSLGLGAVQSVTKSGLLVVETYDKPLMAISYARLALAHFMMAEITLMRRQSTADGEQRRQLDSRMGDLARALQADLGVAEERAMSQEAAEAARAIAASAEEWDATRRRFEATGVDEGYRATLERRAATVVDGLDRLVELTADDGFRDRESALASITFYRLVIIAAMVFALVLGGIVAILLARRLVSPIAAASLAARRIAAGELDVEITGGGGDELGDLLAAMAVMRDNIRTMMEREIAARRSAQTRLINAIESSAEGVMLLDAEGRIVISNSQVVTFFPSLVGAFTPGARLPEAVEAALDSPTGELALADGSWLRLTRSPTPDGGLVVVASDITALKERERILSEAKEEAELASRAKSEFLANMSHELRTPLNAVLGFSEIMVHELLGPLGQPKYKEYVIDIHRSGQHLLEVINDILDIAKLQSGKAELTCEPTRLGDAVDDAMRMICAQANAAGIELTSFIEPGVPVIDGDAKRLRQLLLNLLSNAVKFTPSGGKVAVSVFRTPEDIRIAVSDTGIGIDAKDVPKALEPFTQIENSLTRRHGGTGLGLPLSKLFAELHGGRLEILSTLGRGTTVTVILPEPSRPMPRLALAG